MHSEPYKTLVKTLEAYFSFNNEYNPIIIGAKWNLFVQNPHLATTGSSSWKSWLQTSVLDTFYDILKLSLVLTHPVGWALLLLGKKFDISAQFDYKEWVFWSLLFLQNLRFDGFSVFLKNSFLFQMRINDQI